MKGVANSSELNYELYGSNPPINKTRKKKKVKKKQRWR